MFFFGEITRLQAFGAENVHPVTFPAPLENYFDSIHFSSSNAPSNIIIGKKYILLWGPCWKTEPLTNDNISSVLCRTCTQEYLFNECVQHTTYRGRKSMNHSVSQIPNPNECVQHKKLFPFCFQFKSDLRNIFHSNQNHPQGVFGGLCGSGRKNWLWGERLNNGIKDVCSTVDIFNGCSSGLVVVYLWSTRGLLLVTKLALMLKLLQTSHYNFSVSPPEELEKLNFFPTRQKFSEENYKEIANRKCGKSYFWKSVAELTPTHMVLWNSAFQQSKGWVALYSIFPCG